MKLTYLSKYKYLNPASKRKSMKREDKFSKEEII
jgi:hypothetical protein